jgi:hypothetical protein
VRDVGHGCEGRLEVAGLDLSSFSEIWVYDGPSVRILSNVVLRLVILIFCL